MGTGHPHPEEWEEEKDQRGKCYKKDHGTDRDTAADVVQVQVRMKMIMLMWMMMVMMIMMLI